MNREQSANSGCGDPSPRRDLPGTSASARPIKSSSGLRPSRVRPKKPPPIYIDNVNAVDHFFLMIKSLTSSRFSYIVLDKNRIKLFIDCIEDHAKVVDFLDEHGVLYHTFHIKTGNILRVVIRGLHPSCDTDEVMDELHSLGFEPIKLFPIRRPHSRTPLPLFFLDLKRNSRVQDIYDLKRLYYAVVSVEPVKSKTKILQCTNCQWFGHNRHSCRWQTRCVRCLDDHPLDKCPMPDQSPPLCVNCGGEHKANYRGCPIYKQFAKARTTL